MRILLITVILVSALAVHADNYAHIGKGCTTAYYIDEDCDGYGVGVEYLNGPDADDLDYQYNTKATVEATYGSFTSGAAATAKSNLLTWLSNRQAKAYNITGDVYHISTTGSPTGTVNDYSDPYDSWSTVRPLVSGGDLIVYRGGTYGSEVINCDSMFFDDDPVVTISMPGEAVKLTRTTGSILSAGNSQQYQRGLIFDTLQFGDETLREYDWPTQSHIYFKGVKNIQLNYIEALNSNRYILYSGAGGLSTEDVVLDHCVIHGVGYMSSTNHNIYFAYSPQYGYQSNLTLRNNIIWGNNCTADTQLLHINGHTAPDSGHLIENNIFHSAGGKGVDYMTGVRDSIFRNNIIFNTNKNAFEIYEYSDAGGTATQKAGNNTFANNIFIMGAYRNGLGSTSNPANEAAFDIANSLDSELLVDNNFVNNIFITYSSAAFGFGDTHFENTTYQNNIFYRMDQGPVINRKWTTDWTVAEFESNVVGASNNNDSDPNLVDYNISNCGWGASCTGAVGDNDFHLSALSLNCINMSLSYPGVPIEDLTRYLREGIVDVGPYEYYVPPPCNDSDGDGYNATMCGGSDCNDTNASINPAASEIAYNGVNDDCDVFTRDDDLDSDGYFTLTGEIDCDDMNSSINPGAPEVCENGVDDDCTDGDLDPCPVCNDLDNDTYYENLGCGTTVDCNDTNANIFENRTCSTNGASCGSFSFCLETCPSPPSEICDNEMDDDCDNLTDCLDIDCLGTLNCPVTACDNLVLHYHFDNDSTYGESDTDVYDFSVTGNDAVCSNCPDWNATGLYDGAFRYNGFDDSFDLLTPTQEIHDIFQGQTDFSYSVWFNTQVISLGAGREYHLMGYARRDGTEAFLYLSTAYGTETITYVSRLSYAQTFISTVDLDIETGRWYHVAVVGEIIGSDINMSIYVNGTYGGGGLIPQNNIPDQDNYFYVGSDESFLEPFDGMIEEIGIWDRKLTDQEIADYSTGVISCEAYNPADTNEDGSISNGEMRVYIGLWKAGSASITELLTALELWKS